MEISQKRDAEHELDFFKMEFRLRAARGRRADAARAGKDAALPNSVRGGSARGTGTKVPADGTRVPFTDDFSEAHHGSWQGVAGAQVRSALRGPEVLLGRYEILETIGRGATSSVWKARDTLIGRIVALKTLQPDLSEAKWRERFLGEARIIGQLSHPSIVSLYDVGIEETSGAPFLVMEYVVGQTLERLLASGEIDPRRAYAWGAELARALAYADGHGVIHGDVKPANVLVSEEARVKLTDFGIARWATQVSQTGSLKGTPAFLSPEQIEGRASDGRSDLFSLGIVLYLLVTGQRAFQGDSVAIVCAQILKANPTPPSRINPALPPALDGVLARCLAKNPADRYANGEELAAALEGVARHPTAAASRTTGAKRSAAALLRYVAGAALLVFALSASFTLSFVRHRLRLAPPPERVSSAPRPPDELRPPAEMANRSDETPDLDSSITIEDAPRKPQPKSRVAARNAPARQDGLGPKSAAAAKNRERTLLSNSTPTPQNPQAMPPPKPVPQGGTGIAESARVSASAQLTVEVSARPSEDSVAVFADRQLLFSASLAVVAGKEGEPFRTVYTLPPGQHHLSVALYKADKTLRSEKEGLAELRKGAPNVLAIRVTKRSKLMPLRGPGLKITWPGEAASSEAAHSPADPAAKTSAKK